MPETYIRTLENDEDMASYYPPSPPLSASSWDNETLVEEQLSIITNYSYMSQNDFPATEVVEQLARLQLAEEEEIPALSIPPPSR